MRIREKAELEIPHILLLIDDDENIVIERDRATNTTFNQTV